MLIVKGLSFYKLFKVLIVCKDLKISTFKVVALVLQTLYYSKQFLVISVIIILYLD